MMPGRVLTNRDYAGLAVWSAWILHLTRAGVLVFCVSHLEGSR